jgi:hypothetical protein
MCGPRWMTASQQFQNGVIIAKPRSRRGSRHRYVGDTPLPMLKAGEMQSLMLPPEEDEQTAAPALRVVK